MEKTIAFIIEYWPLVILLTIPLLLIWVTDFIKMKRLKKINATHEQEMLASEERVKESIGQLEVHRKKFYEDLASIGTEIQESLKAPPINPENPPQDPPQDPQKNPKEKQ